ncbi:DUF4186 family protein [Saccharopolyspora sp. NPDC050389]|uniref:DUF4186 family protein n=1 Tax=Saccharopolyspora sp. NPDC050389 TaxID=3155516 RepID=UPI003404ADF7
MPFRAKFQLRVRDRAMVELRGLATVRRHAEELVGDRLAPPGHATTQTEQHAAERFDQRLHPPTAPSWRIRFPPPGRRGCPVRRARGVAGCC